MNSKKKEINNTRTTAGPVPTIHKNGALCRGVEQTPVIWNGELLLVISIGEAEGAATRSVQVWNPNTGEGGKPFAEGFYYPCAYVENGTMYVFASSTHVIPNAAADDKESNDPCGGNSIYMFTSTDLENWTATKIIESSALRFWNTSVCKDESGYVMAIEVSIEKTYGADNPYTDFVGRDFTSFFAKSPDLVNWELMPPECSYTPARYNACPTIRYLKSDGFYYMICLELLPCYRFAPYIYRSSDFETWEVGVHNPIMMYGDEDRKPKKGLPFSEEDENLLGIMVNTNNSDVDICEFNGRTYVYYAAGNQLGYGFLCEAYFDGTEEEFLQSFFKRQ